MLHFPDLPAPMRKLPLDARGYPVPWFVAWQDGRPIFPAMDERKLTSAIINRRCWVCGGQLGRLSAFVIGPMCAVNRTAAEPPSHLECARFSARRCPFLASPRMKRVPVDHYDPEHIRQLPAGRMLERNPGVALVWIVKGAGTPYRVANGILFDIGAPHRVEFYAEGRPAKRAEIMASIETGLPFLQEMVERDPDRAGAQAELDRSLAAALELLPAA